MIAQMVIGRKLVSSFSMPAIYSFLKYLRYRQAQTSSGSVEKTQLRLGSPLRGPFFYPSQSLFGFRPILCEPLR